MKFPKELYAMFEDDSGEQNLIAIPDAEGFAVVGDVVKAMLYRKVGFVMINAPLSVTKPKEGK